VAFSIRQAVVWFWRPATASSGDADIVMSFYPSNARTAQKATYEPLQKTVSSARAVPVTNQRRPKSPDPVISLILVAARLSTDILFIAAELLSGNRLVGMVRGANGSLDG
jgi:hypothetical protein